MPPRSTLRARTSPWRRFRRLGAGGRGAAADRGGRAGDLRFADGVVFQHLVAGPRTIGALAERLGVSQQAASKAVADLERRGYVRREADPGDGRARLVALTARGDAAIEAGRRHRAAVEAELAAGSGRSVSRQRGARSSTRWRRSAGRGRPRAAGAAAAGHAPDELRVELDGALDRVADGRGPEDVLVQLLERGVVGVGVDACLDLESL